MMKKKIYVWSFFALCLVACANHLKPENSTYAYKQDVLLPLQFDESVRVQDDIYQFVNGRWLEFNPPVQGRVLSSPVSNLIEKTNSQLSELLLGLSSLQYKQDSDEFKLNLLYQEYTDEVKRESLKLIPLNELFAQIDALHNQQQLVAFLSLMLQQGREIPFVKWEVAPSYQGENYKIYLKGPNIVLDSYYFNENSPKNRKILKQYNKFLQIVLQHLSIDDSRDQAQKIQALEAKLASFTVFESESIQNTDLINFKHSYVAKHTSSLSAYETVLKVILKSIHPQTEHFFIKNSEYFTQLDNILKNTSLDFLKNYLKYFYFVYYSDYLDNVSYRLVFNFNQYQLQARKIQRTMPIKYRALKFVNNYMGQALGKVYVKHYFPERKKKQILEMAKYIKKNFRVRLENNHWMSDSTKRVALKKLDKLQVKIGYPEKWQNYADLKLPDTHLNLVQIVEQLDSWNFKQNQAKVDTKVDDKTWSIYPQEVNAYYDILKNEVIYPAAILQPPFYHENSDPAVLYGTLGALMGHEMTHGFDLRGSNYDALGDYKAWWSDEDRHKFNVKAKALVEQFNQYTVIDNIKVNGLKTLNENIADSGGLNIAYDALNDYLKDRKIENISSFSQAQRFFLAWASLFKGTDSEEELKNSYQTYVHSPDSVRSFAPLLNMDAFYKAFNIKPGDRHYIEPEKRIQIW